MEQGTVSAQEFFGTSAPMPVAPSPSNQASKTISAQEFFGNSAPQLVPNHPNSLPASPAPSPSYNLLTPEGETNLGNALGKVFPGADLGKAVGSSAYSIGQLLAGTYHTIAGHHEKATENFNNAFGGAASGSDINKALADAVQAGLVTMPAAGKGLTTVGKALEGAAAGYGFDVTQNVKTADNTDVISNPKLLKPGVGTVVGGTLPLITDILGGLAKKGASMSAGTGGPDVLQRMIDNPDVVQQSVEKYATTPEAKQNIIDRMKAGISEFLNSNQQEYSNTIKRLTPQAPVQLNVANQSFADNISKFGGSINDEGDLVFGKSTALTSQDQRDLQSAWKTISNWDDSSIQGADNLRQAIQNNMDDFQLNGNARANLILGNVKQDLVSHVAQSAQGYQEMLDNYGAKKQVASQLVKELSINNGNTKLSTQMNNIMTLFRKDKSVRDMVEKVLGPQETEKFLNDLSGAILSDLAPVGRMGNYVRAGIDTAATTSAALAGGPVAAAVTAAGSLAASSPKIVGQVARGAGIAKKFGAGPALRKVATFLSSKMNH